VSFVEVVEVVVRVIESVAVAILAFGVLWGLGRAVVERVQGSSAEEVVAATRLGLGRVLLLGLEVLIAADIIATVALDLNLESVAALGLVVLIRTFLSWAIEVESYGHWPWQAATRRGALAPEGEPLGEAPSS
jgi:uncharacterized membrane protein